MPWYPISYAALYHDAYGEEHTTLTNRGRDLTMVVRGITFTDTGLDGFEPIDKSSDLSAFTIKHGCLWGYSLTFTMPIPIQMPTGTQTCALKATIRVDAPDRQGDILTVQLSLDGNAYTIHTPEMPDYEMALIHLQNELPEDHHLMCCWHCAWSDYPPYGNGTFGDLACFRGAKAQYSTVKDKYDLIQIWDTMTEFVQETHRCEQFQPRQPDTGYRG